MLALDLLRIPFAWAMHLGFQMPGVRPPMVGVKACETKGLQQRFELQKDRILATPKDIGQDRTREVIERMPESALVPFLADITPHFIHLPAFL